TLQHGRVRLGPGDTEIRDLDARLSFAGNEVRIERCEGASSRSGRVRLSGRATLGREGPGGSAGALDLSLEEDQFRFVDEHLERFSSGLRGTTVRGTLQTVDRENVREPSPIRIRGPWTHPQVTGALRIADATGPLPVALTSRKPVASLPFDADLDLRLV